MSNYTKSTNFATKDALASGNPLKIVKGTEIDTEFNNIATAIATKADLASPTFTGTPALPTGTTGVTQSAGDNTTALATTAFVQSTTTTAVSTKADKAITISAGTGLSGGGDLSANRTLSIANTGVSAGTYGSATAVPVIGVNAQGQITSLSTATPFSWNATYIDVTVGENDSYSLPANCILIAGYVLSGVAGNTGGLGRITVRNSGGAAMGYMFAGTSSGNDGGGGWTDYFPVTIPIPAGAASLYFSRDSGGRTLSLILNWYVTR